MYIVYYIYYIYIYIYYIYNILYIYTDLKKKSINGSWSPTQIEFLPGAVSPCHQVAHPIPERSTVRSIKAATIF